MPRTPAPKQEAAPSRRRRRAALAPAPADWFVYLLTCGDGTFYTGVARDVAARLEQHRSGRGARYTRGRGPLAVVHVEPAATRGDAQRREAAIKRLRRAGKVALAASPARHSPTAKPPDEAPTGARPAPTERPTGAAAERALRAPPGSRSPQGYRWTR